MKVDHSYIHYPSKGYLEKGYSINMIISDPKIVLELTNEGYTKFTFLGVDFCFETNYDIVMDSIERFKKSFIFFRRYLSPSEVTETFQYDITLQICGRHITSFGPLYKGTELSDENIITFKSFEGNTYWAYGPDADVAFGEKFKSENPYLTDSFRDPYEYRKHISEIEKIFLTKKFRDVEQIGSDHEHRFNGKIEVLELDLRNPDMEIYEKMRAIDNCIEIEWEP